METARTITNDITVLPSYAEIGNFGILPVNSYVLKASQPVLVDTGLRVDSPEFMAQLRSVIDPADLRWLYLTHPDADHIGSLRTLLEEAPQMRIVTTFLGVGILSLSFDIPLDRYYLLNPGESLDIGDRQITVVKPPIFDNPSTTAFIDSKTRALFSSDCFGALLEGPAEVADDVDVEALRAGQRRWATIDAPWLHKVSEDVLARELKAIQRMEPSMVLSAHLPTAYRMMDTFVNNLSTVPGSEPFVGPNQAALEALLASITQTPEPVAA